MEGAEGGGGSDDDAVYGRVGGGEFVDLFADVLSVGGVGAGGPGPVE